jgi:hypothetical protein
MFLSSPWGQLDAGFLTEIQQGTQQLIDLALARDVVGGSRRPPQLNANGEKLPRLVEGEDVLICLVVPDK